MLGQVWEMFLKFFNMYDQRFFIVQVQLFAFSLAKYWGRWFFEHRLFFSRWKIYEHMNM